MRAKLGRCSLLAAFLLVSAVATAQTEQPTAAQHFEQGLRLIESQAYAQAVPEFEAAYRLSPHPAALYNLGQAYAALNRPTLAVDAFSRMLEQHAESVDSEQRRAVQELIREQREKLGRIAISIDPAETRVVVDGVPVEGRTIASGLDLDSGTHVVELSAPGRKSQILHVKVVAGNYRLVAHVV